MFEKVAKLLSQYLGVDEKNITKDTDIKKDLKADSLALFEMLYELEQETGVIIPDEMADSIATVGEVVTYIENNMKKKK